MTELKPAVTICGLGERNSKRVAVYVVGSEGVLYVTIDDDGDQIAHFHDFHTAAEEIAGAPVDVETHLEVKP